MILYILYISKKVIFIEVNYYVIYQYIFSTYKIIIKQNINRAITKH